MSENLKTRIHYYHLNTRNDIEAGEWRELERRLISEVKAGKRGHCMSAFPGGTRLPRVDNKTEDIVLETAFIFSNQWNSTTSRVFDWRLYYWPQNHNIKTGHWLEITPEMDEARRNQLICGYCGKRYDSSEGVGWCTACVGSKYLKRSELHLLRLLPASLNMPDRKKLSEKEADELGEAYETDQAERLKAWEDGQNRRLQEKRARLEREFKEKEGHERVKLDGLSWLLNHGKDTDNVIYYSHKGVFSFGWRDALTNKEASELLDLLCEFPFEYELKSAGGNVSTVVTK